MNSNAVQTLHIKQFEEFLKPRKRDAHKGLYGHVLVVGGDYGFSGAVHMAAEAALRVGAGLVSIATRTEHALTINSSRPEIMCHGIRSVKTLKTLLNKVTVVILGPGMGQSAWAVNLFKIVIKSKLPIVMDADGLNILAKKSTKYSQWILTPHPGEAARLLKMNIQNIQEDRLAAIQKLQQGYGGVCVLKGAGSLISGPNEPPVLCAAGNPGMATGGMGDILSGVIGGLVAQGMSLYKAAQCGVLIHAMAGDLAAREGGERGMIATDLLPFLRYTVNI